MPKKDLEDLALLLLRKERLPAEQSGFIIPELFSALKNKKGVGEDYAGKD